MSELTEYLKSHPCKGFKPLPTVTQNGNAIQWYWDDEPSYAEPIHHDGVWIGSVNRAMSDKRVVGVTIHMESIKGLEGPQ